MNGEKVIAKGFEEGGEPWRIEKAISDEPQAAEELGAKAGVTSGRVKTHCRYWIARGVFYVEAPVGQFYYLRTGDQPKGRRTNSGPEIPVMTRPPKKAGAKKHDDNRVEANGGFRALLAAHWRSILRANQAAIFGTQYSRLLDRHDGDRLAQPGFVGPAFERGGLVFVAMNPGNGGDGNGPLDTLQYEALRELRDCPENDTETCFITRLTPVLEQIMPQFKISHNFVLPVLVRQDWGHAELLFYKQFTVSPVLPRSAVVYCIPPRHV